MSAKKGNKYAVGNKGGGRNPIYNSPDHMQKKINEYFDSTQIWTVPGLAYYLGFADRQSLIDYEKKDEFFFAIKRAKLRIEAFNAEQLHMKNNNTTGIIFTLKNMGWSDKQDLDLNFDFESLTDEQLDRVINELKEKLYEEV